jgi:hypothetical protein
VAKIAFLSPLSSSLKLCSGGFHNLSLCHTVQEEKKIFLIAAKNTSESRHVTYCDRTRQGEEGLKYNGAAYVHVVSMSEIKC